MQIIYVQYATNWLRQIEMKGADAKKREKTIAFKEEVEIVAHLFSPEARFQRASKSNLNNRLRSLSTAEKEVLNLLCGLLMEWDGPDGPNRPC